MQFVNEEKGVKLKFSWKERFFILFYGLIRFNRKSSYEFYGHFMALISEGVKLYGSYDEHGQTELGKKLTTVTFDKK